MCWSETQTYRAEPSTPATARRFIGACLRQALGEQPRVMAVTDDAALAVSELVTNAINAGATTVTVGLMIHHDHLRLAVSDNAAGIPQMRTPSPHATGGRGLRITAQLARDWGTATTRDGKQVWAELSLEPTTTTTLNCTI